MVLTFDTHGNEKQKEVAINWLDPTVSDIVYGGAKGTGKSYLGASLIFGDAFLYPDTMYFIARKSLNDIRKFTLPTIFEVFDSWRLSKGYYNFNGQDNYFTLHNGSKVFMIEARHMPSDPLYQRFGSMQMTRGWIEEAGEFETAAASNLKASLGRWKNDVYNLPLKCLQTCNPSKNYLYSEYYKKNKEGKLDSWKRFIQALPTDNKMLAPGYLEHLERTLTANEKERLLHGNWEYDDDPTILMDYDKIIDIFTNTHVASGQKYITADIARLGDDKTKIRIWDGLRSIKKISQDKSRVDEIAKLIKQLQQQYAVPNSNTIVDEDGVGGGVVDILRCKGFVNNSSPIPVNGVTPNYKNLKEQCIFKLADLVNQNALYLSDSNHAERELIIEEFEHIKQVSTEGKLATLSKDEIKALIGRSPDEFDSILMRMYPELKPTIIHRGTRVAS
jgi:hypothetical protein